MFLFKCSIKFYIPQELKKTKSLAESVHLATLQVLEQKLGNKTATPPPPKPPTPEPPPPLPVLPPPPKPKEPTQSLEVVERKVMAAPPKQKVIIDYTTLEKVTTRLFPQSKDSHLTYSSVPWELDIKKEVSIYLYLC